MTELETMAQRRVLLPGGPRKLYAVRFWRSSKPDQGRSPDLAWADCFTPVSVDLDRAPELSGWFDVPRTPMLAVITDGAMLGITYDLDQVACTRLAECARWQYGLMRDMAT